jgi:hypothetical protein
MALNSSFMVTGGLDGDLKASYFGVFPSHLKRSCSVVTIKNR